MKKKHLVTSFVARKRLEFILAELAKLDKSAIKVLDVGCGNREVTNAIKAKGYNIIGIDKVSDAEWMKGRRPDLVMDATAMTFPDNAFDAIIALEIVEHAPCIPEICRVLKKKGLFFCSTPTPHTDWVRHILVRTPLLEDQDFKGHDYLINLRTVPRVVPLKLIFYKKMFGGTSQFGIFTK